MSPQVTVLMSVYNGEKYLREAIESIINQTYSNFEFLIMNDGSTDTTREIILSYDDPRITLIENNENMGLSKSSWSLIFHLYLCEVLTRSPFYLQ